MSRTNEDVAAAFDELADLLALSGANRFRIQAYRRAAREIRGLAEELTALLARGFEPVNLPGVGADLAGKIRELLASGRCALLERLRRKLPAGLRELLAVRGLGPARARALHAALGIADRDGLRRALLAHRVREVPGFGARLEANLLKELNARAGAAPRMLRALAIRHANALREFLAAVPGVERVEIAGSCRRGRDSVGDLDLVVSAGPRAPVRAALLDYEQTAAPLLTGPTRLSVSLRCGLQADVRVVPPESFGAALFYFTGSKAHNIHVRRLAAARGLKVNEYGVFRGRRRIAGDSEESVYAALGLPYIVPELREDRGEIEAAAAGALPRLLQRSDLRGDLHVHTNASDGSASLAAMAQAAQRAGLQYIAITDHSKFLGAVHGLDSAALDRQIDQIDRFNAEHQRLTVLKGVEVDILGDGKLALPDSILRRLDIVVAAVHVQFNLSRRRQTERLLRALDRPHVSILAHPSTRLIEERPPLECDWPAVFARAKARPCYLELNSQPQRLDLDDTLVRAAAGSGVQISIASDAHATRDFDDLEYGVLQARRGWLGAGQVLNSRSLAALRPLLRRTSL